MPLAGKLLSSLLLRVLAAEPRQRKGKQGCSLERARPGRSEYEAQDNQQHP